VSADLEAARAAEREVEGTRASGRKLAVHILDDFAQLFAGMASYYQPGSPKELNPNADPVQFEKWARFAVDTAKAIAPYQSATMRAIAVAPAPQSEQITTRRFTLRVFDRDLTTMSTEQLVQEYRSRVAAGPAAPETIEHDANELPAAAAKDAPEPQPEPAAPSQPVMLQLTRS